MCTSWRLLVALLILTGAAQVAPVSGPTDEELAQNRRLLDRWRAGPEHYARLKRQWRAFRALPPDRQARIRQLDRDLHQEDVETQTRLGRTLERYVSWLERLPEADRQPIESTA